MSSRYSENGNRRMKPSSQPEPLTVSDFKLEFVLTGVMLAFAAVVYIILSILGITPGLGGMCAGSEKKPEPDPEPAAVISESSVSEADSAPSGGEPHDMGTRTLFLCRTASLVPEDEKCTSYESSNEEVATVSADGTVTPVAVGDADIKGTAASGNTYTWHLEIKKVAYLMFSDFPNEDTNTILDVLKDKNVKATFFVCLRSKEEYFPIYRRMIDEGHTVGNHTSSHDVEKLFASTDDFKSSIIKLENYLDLNFSYRTKFVSIPNGTGTSDQNTVSTKVTVELHEKGYSLVDWTLEVGDYKEMSKQEIIDAVKNKAKNDREVISMHNYSETARALPEIIQYLSEHGYGFECFDDAPEVYNQYYGWETNVNRRGAGTYTEEMLSGFHYKQD